MFKITDLLMGSLPMTLTTCLLAGGSGPLEEQFSTLLADEFHSTAIAAVKVQLKLLCDSKTDMAADWHNGALLEYATSQSVPRQMWVSRC
jgi:hypothetical protein